MLQKKRAEKSAWTLYCTYIHLVFFFCSFYNYVCGTPEIILSVKQNVLFLFVKKI